MRLVKNRGGVLRTPPFFLCYRFMLQASSRTAVRPMRGGCSSCLRGVEPEQHNSHQAPGEDTIKDSPGDFHGVAFQFCQSVGGSHRRIPNNDKRVYRLSKAKRWMSRLSKRLVAVLYS